MMVLCFLSLSYFNNYTMLLTILCNFYGCYVYHIYSFSLRDEADRTAVGYVCILGVTSYGSKFLQLFNSCYHMVGMSKITAGVLMYQFKESEEPIPVPIRSYVSILIDNLFSTTGTGTWHTPVS